MKEYINEIRNLIGTRPLLLCGASMIIFDQEGRVLMQHRTDNHCWGFPGGAVELGEKVEEAAKREVLEETGLVIDEMELFGVFSGEELHYTYPNGDEVYIIDVVYRSSNYLGELKINEESKEVNFFHINDLPSNISPPVVPVVAALKSRLLDGVQS